MHLLCEYHKHTQEPTDVLMECNIFLQLLTYITIPSRFPLYEYVYRERELMGSDLTLKYPGLHKQTNFPQKPNFKKPVGEVTHI